MARCQRSKLVWAGREEWIGRHDECLGALISEIYERPVNFGHCACIKGPQFPSICNGRRLYVSHLHYRIRKGWIHQHTDGACFGHQFEDQFQTLLPKWDVIRCMPVTLPPGLL